MFSQQIREIQTLTEEQISPQVVEVLKTAVSKLQCFDPQSDPEILVRQFRRLIIDSDLATPNGGSVQRRNFSLS